ELAELCAKGGLLWVDVQGLGERGGDARPPRTEDEKGFVRAEDYSVDDLVQHHTEAAIKTAGKLRVEGREYVMRESDVCHFLVNR
ncbi:MAG TPA: DUF933 domain-containing protein, partial [Planctomycetota bacterium]